MTPERLEKLRHALDRRQPDLTVLTEDIRKPHNVAAMVRTCDAVGIGELHTVAETLLRHHRMIAAGSRRWVHVHRHDSLDQALHQLRDQGFSLVAAHQSRRATDYRDIDYTKPTAIIVGSELWGVSATAAARADQHVQVPMHGLTASLNVSVATALVLYEALRQREQSGFFDSPRLSTQRYRELLFEWSYPRIARRCRKLNRPYPRMAYDGTIEQNTLGRGKNGNSEMERRCPGAK